MFPEPTMYWPPGGDRGEEKKDSYPSSLIAIQGLEQAQKNENRSGNVIIKG